MVELGKIEKPQADEYSRKRKLYCIPNIYPLQEADSGYDELVSKYWEEVDRQIEKMEIAGRAQKIFCELIFQQGDEALDALDKINARMVRIIRRKLGEGSTLIPLEDRDILGQYTDWGNCLQVVFTREVFSRVLEFYREFSEKRLQHVLNVIDTNLAEAEAGLLFMKDDDRAKIQFPKDIEVFLITPPSYDDIMRWVRDRLLKKSGERG